MPRTSIELIAATSRERDIRCWIAAREIAEVDPAYRSPAGCPAEIHVEHFPS
jgi:hypothetical protein